MRWRIVTIVSLGANIALVLYLVSRATRSGARSAAQVASSPASEAQVRTNFVVRRLSFSWREVESPDYPTYIANLREIGCPEQTIRDIIIADVNSLYSRRRSTEVQSSEQQWWRSQPDTNVVLVAAQRLRELDDERRGLLTRLLGQHWEAADLLSLPRPMRRGIMLDGPILGDLTLETKQSVEEINAQAQDRLEAYLDAMQKAGKPADAAELARLRQQTREELAGVLNPSQLEEYQLRYSQSAKDLRAFFAQLRFFDSTPDEFRQVFRSTEQFDLRIDELTGNDDPNMVAHQKSLIDQREYAIKTALGPARYDEYRMLQDPIYRDSVAAARELGTPESARLIYQSRLDSAVQSAVVQADPGLSPEQKAIEQKKLELEKLQADAILAGKVPLPEPEAPPPPPRKTYIVQPGDTASLVALFYNVPVNAIRAANPNVDLTRLKPGVALTIPASDATFPPLPP